MAATDLNVAPGSIVLVRDKEWLVTSVEQTTDGQLLHVTGTSELVRDKTASFFPSIDVGARALDPQDATVIADGSSHYRKARLWLESTIRGTSTPLSAYHARRLPARPGRPASLPDVCAPRSCRGGKSSSTPKVVVRPDSRPRVTALWGG